MPPWFAQKKKRAGKTKNSAIVKGLAFERKWGKILRQNFEGMGELYAGAWIRFEDEDGIGWAQPDFFLVESDRVVVWECKLTQCDIGWEQLHYLYAPLLIKLYEKPVVCMQVCKYMVKRVDTVLTDPKAVESGALIHYIH